VRCGEHLYTQRLAEQPVQPQVKNCAKNAHGAEHDQPAFFMPDFLRVSGGGRSGGYRNPWRKQCLEGFMIRMSIVHRHFAGVIKFVTVDDDFRVQLRSEAGPGMKLSRLVYSAIICRSDIYGHLVGICVLTAVEPDIRLGLRAHYKDQ